MAIRIVRDSVAIVFAVSAGGVLLAQRGPQQPPMIREGVTEKISEHVHVIPDGNVGLVPNVTMVVGERGTLVVDTGLGARNGEAVLREVAKIRRGGELYLATTHVHPEHDLGAHAFPPATTMIRSRDQVSEIADTGPDLSKRFASFSPLTAELLQGAAFREADIVFDQEYNLDLGGVRVQVMAMGNNHTRGDTAFFVVPDAVLVTGDIVMSALPAVGGTSRVSTWLASFDRFEKLKPARIVPSHGPMGDASMIEKYREYLTAIQTRVAAHKKAGRSLEETLKLVQDDLQDRYDRNRMAGAIRVAYNEAP